MIIIYRESVVCYKNESLCKFYLALYLLCFYLFIHYTYKYCTIRNPNLIFKLDLELCAVHRLQKYFYLILINSVGLIILGIRCTMLYDLNLLMGLTGQSSTNQRPAISRLPELYCIGFIICGSIKPCSYLAQTSLKLHSNFAQTLLKPHSNLAQTSLKRPSP